MKADLIGSDDADARFDGCVVLGCVIRGETTHYETVCCNANHWLMEIAVRNAIPLGNAILTVNNRSPGAGARAGGRKGKGAEAVRACLALVAMERVFARGSGMTAPNAKRDKRGDIARSRARLATVQALYQMDLAETDLIEVIEEFKQHSAGRQRRWQQAWADADQRALRPACCAEW